MDIFIKIVQFVLSLSILVLFHEFGHFLFAKLFKTRVEKFYMFFNPWFSLFKFKKGETEYGVGWLPLGGYVKIAEVSKEYGLSADTLRYYERIGLLPNVTRTASGIRDYSEQDCARVQFVKCMRAASVSIEALIEYMALYDQGDSTLEARKTLLEEQRALVERRIAEMQAGLDRLNFKIDNYDKTIHDCEKKLRGEA